MVFNRQTLAQEFKLEGLGLHSGRPVTLRVFPGQDGIRFRYNGSVTLAHPANISDVTRCTRLGEVATIEHLMSAFAGTEVTDAEVELDAPELPGVDGSALPFVELIRETGVVEIGQRELPDLYSRIFFQEDQIKIAIGKGAGHWRFDYETGERWPGTMSFDTTQVVDDYASEIAPARTFALIEEIPMIMKLGLGLGLDKETALVLGEEGYKNDVRFPDEPARHKLLDLIGDLYLTGVPIRFLNVVGTRSGHRTHVEIAKLLAQALKIDP
jgi:UDP-3-O-[3-hydroxymyristoyl] N-acetylglucosamine deacetylase